MEKTKTIPVFNQKLVAKLLEEGFVVDHTDKNRKNKDKLVYFFRFCPGIYDILNEKGNNKGVRRNAR